MADELICLDTSVLIDYFRKTKKENSFLFELTSSYSSFAVSVVTKFEILIGSTEAQQRFWEDFFSNIEVIPFDEIANKEAVAIFKELKKSRKQIDMPDLFIGATSKGNQLKLKKY